MAITRRVQDRGYFPRFEPVVLTQAETGERWGNLPAQLPVLKPDFRRWNLLPKNRLPHLI